MALPSTISLVLTLTLLGPLGSPSVATDAGSPGISALEAALTTYASTPSFRETLDLRLETSDGSARSRRRSYGVTSDGGAFFTLSGEENASLTVVAREGRAVAVWSHVSDRYAQVPYEDDLSDVFRTLEASRAGISAPAPVVAAQGGDLRSFLDALRFGVLGPLTIDGVRRHAGDSDELVEVSMSADNGRAVLGLDPQTHRFRSIRFSLGGEDRQLRGDGRFRFEAGPVSDAPELPDLSGRVAVSSLPALEAPDLPLGEVVTGIELWRPTGDAVRLEELRGQVVVLDFWATWCVPCWKGLEATEELATWAASSDLPVQVFAVDTLEQSAAFDDQKSLALDFLKSRRLDLPLLVDVGGSAFARLRNPGLPSLLVIAPDGRLVDHYSEIDRERIELVRREVMRLLDKVD